MISDDQLRGLGLPGRAVLLWGPLIRALSLAVLIGVGAHQLLACAAIANTTITTRDLADFGVFYEAGRRARARDPNPYSAQSPAAPNLNPPTSLFAFVPLSLLPRHTAFLLYVVLSLSCAAIALRIAFREVGIRQGPTAWGWALVLLLCSAPTAAVVTFAQFSWILWAPVTWTWAAVRGGRVPRAAAIGGVLISLKPFLGLFVPALLVQQRPRLAAIATLMATVCFGMAILVFGWQVMTGWFRALMAVTWGGNVFNASIFGLCQRLFAPSAATVAIAPLVHAPMASVVLSLSGALVVLALSMKAVRRLRTDCSAVSVDYVFVVTLSAALLVTPLGWTYYHVYLVGPFLGLLSTPQWRSGLRMRWALIAVAILCFLLPPPILLLGQPSAWATLSIGSAYFWGTLAIWGVLMVQPPVRSS